MNDEFYTPEDIAKMLKINVMTVYRWIKAKKLKAYKLERQLRVKKNDFNKFLNTRKS